MKCECGHDRKSHERKFGPCEACKCVVFVEGEMGDLIKVTCDKCGKQILIVPGDEEICHQCEEGA
jgi:hypothetical protein